MSLFDLCRSLKSQDVAARMGFEIVQRGNRSWTLCPFHHEKAPSLLFNPNGRWHCFGCGQSGDAVSFYSQIKKLTPYQAAKELIFLFGSALLPNTYKKAYLRLPEEELKHTVETWVAVEQRKAWKIRDHYQRMINCEHAWIDKNLNPSEPYEPNNTFYSWVKKVSDAQLRLESLDPEQPYEMMLMMLEEMGHEFT